MTTAQFHALRSHLSELRERGYSNFHHGDCVGADDEAQRVARECGFLIFAHPPLSDDYRAFARYDWRCPAKGYLERNRDIVDQASFLLAAPSTPDEQQRSGTWSTVRYARSRFVPVTILW